MAGRYRRRGRRGLEPASGAGSAASAARREEHPPHRVARRIEREMPCDVVQAVAAERRPQRLVLVQAHDRIGECRRIVGDLGLLFGLRAIAIEIHSAIIMLYKYRSEEHTSELQSLMRISYAVFCLKKNNHTPNKVKK